MNFFMKNYALPIRFGIAASGCLIAYFLILSLLGLHTNVFYSLFNGVITGFSIYCNFVVTMNSIVIDFIILYVHPYYLFVVVDNMWKKLNVVYVLSKRDAERADTIFHTWKWLDLWQLILVEGAKNSSNLVPM